MQVDALRLRYSQLRSERSALLVTKGEVEALQLEAQEVHALKLQRAGLQLQASQAMQLRRGEWVLPMILHLPRPPMLMQ